MTRPTTWLSSSIGLNVAAAYDSFAASSCPWRSLLLSLPLAMMGGMSALPLALVVAACAGAAGWLAASARAATELRRARIAEAQANARLEAERGHAANQAELLADAERRLADAFAAVSREALDQNARSFLELAGTRLAQEQAQARGDLDQRRQAVEHLVAPLQQALERVEHELAGIEAARQQAYAGLTAQVRGLTESQDRLRKETTHLAAALRSPQVRGRWGEVQLRRVVELAGMVPHCDFVEQATLERAGVVRRPDLVVNLPGGRRLAVDAKVPLAAYLEAHEAGEDDDRRALLLREHSRQLRSHVNALADKAYWEQFPLAPDFVVLFIPGEPFLAAAFDHEPGLFEYAHSRRVLLATPTTLIALLQSVAVGWRHEVLADNAAAVCETGRELYRRLSTMGEHVTAVGRALDKAVDAYNRQVGSLESRVLVTARKLADLGVGDGSELVSPEPVERAARAPQADELIRLTRLPGRSGRPGDEVA
jgi:DNA recombination protein RmuC